MTERRPRRRRGRRARLTRRRVALLGAAVLVLLGLAAVVAGGLRAGSESTSYEASVDRSYALEVRTLVSRSSALDRQLHSLLTGMPRQRRPTLESTLDTLVRSSEAVATAARTAATPAPSGGAGAQVVLAMAERAQAVSDLRTLVDRLLGMSPLPPAGSADPVSARAPRPISPSRAAAALRRVSALVARADRAYAQARRQLRAAPGRAAIPPSAWASPALSWHSGAARAFVGALTRSPTLVAVHDVGLVTHAIVLTPAPVPSASASGRPGTVLPPTSRVQLAAVVANRGNVAERGVVVEAAIRPATGAHGTKTLHRRTVSLGAHDAVSVSMPALPVVPDHGYTVTVSVVPPGPDAPGAVTRDTLTLHIAPPAAPVVAQLLPDKGPAGSAMAILGTGFTWVSAVEFGTVHARFVVVSPGQITVLVPAAARGAGPVAVRVVNPGGVSARSPADRFTYRAK